jgi:hypothetical protein
MFSRINLVSMPHKGWMKMDEIFTLTLTLFPTPLGGFFPFSWWPLIFHFYLVTTLLWHRYLQHVCSFPPPFLHSTLSIQCWSLCNVHVAPAIFAQLFGFPYFAIFLQDYYDVHFNSIFDSSKLSLIVQWETIWGTKACGWPCSNKGIREDKS